MIKTTIPIDARAGKASFKGAVDLLTEEHGWKSILLIPEQNDLALYDEIIREAIRATRGRIDIHALAVFAVDDAGYQSVVDFDIHPTLFVANSKHVHADTAKVFSRLQGARATTLTTEDVSQLAMLPSKVFESVAKFKAAIAHARKGNNDFGLPSALAISADDAETILVALARSARLEAQLNAPSIGVEGDSN